MILLSIWTDFVKHIQHLTCARKRVHRIHLKARRRTQKKIGRAEKREKDTRRSESKESPTPWPSSSGCRSILASLAVSPQVKRLLFITLLFIFRPCVIQTCLSTDRVDLWNKSHWGLTRIRPKLLCEARAATDPPGTSSTVMMTEEVASPAVQAVVLEEACKAQLRW